ncbi:uncharacterized protein LOC132561533 [Ylistrum balloti]|uniref:uncharacterized protein LOC132561533 n=1 Tax=Ylistrum balloti TaxID=509963 RepID=UPI00290581DA|nr:uncharacterized protein LOC132561533 [Ylistrum balloti]
MVWKSFIILVAAVCFRPSECCTCRPGGDLADYYCSEDTELILRGVAVNKTLISGSETDFPWDGIMSYAFEITDIIKATGNSSRLIEGKSVVNIKASTNEAMCGTTLYLGEDYVIVFTGGSFWIHLCTWKQAYQQMSPFDRDVFEDDDFNCIKRNCIPLGDDALICCRLDQRGGYECTDYEGCVTDPVKENSRCCTASQMVPRECIDYPGLLWKK